MRRFFLALAFSVLAGSLAAPDARAVLLYSNAPELGVTQTGDCAYNTTCGPFNSVNTFAAQLFTLAQAATITGAGFNAIVQGAVFATSANWKILDNDGAFGLPGSPLASGNAAVTNAVGPVGAVFPTTDYSFAIPATLLAAGDYYLAIQAVTTNVGDYLSRGVAASGAAQSNDGGGSWTSGYRGFTSVAVSLTGELGATSVPEPASLVLFGFGLAGLAAARAKRQSSVTMLGSYSPACVTGIWCWLDAARWAGQGSSSIPLVPAA